MLNKLWDNVSIWQKRLALIASIIFLYPIVSNIIKETKQIIEFQQQSRQIVDDIEDLNGYILCHII